MPAADPSSPPLRGQKTICIPCSPEEYQQVVGDPERFRSLLDRHIEATPELFPAGIRRGYRMKDLYRSRKTGCELRRMLHRGRPGPPFLRKYAVPFWALTEVFGRSPMY